MNVKVIETESGKILGAKIVSNDQVRTDLPSVTEGWRFNFNKHAKKKNRQTYILYCPHSPEIIEGCLIFEMKNTVEPYMAYIEIAPHNRHEKSKLKNVAECLIAFACRLSFVNGKGDYLGWLAFDVFEERKEDEAKLMALYSSKYKALRLDSTTTMVIPPEGGEQLIDEFLNN
ncbi:MAG: hypothetical protein RIB86_25060 [Imperialibacter sp.]